MKNVTFLVLLLASMTLTVPAHALITTMTIDDVLCSSIAQLDGQYSMDADRLYALYYSVGGHTGLYKGFAEFDLQGWNAVNLPATSILCVDFLADYQFASTWAEFDLCAMDAGEDGVIAATEADMNVPVTTLASFYHVPQGQGLLWEVTDSFMQDINAGRSYSGYSLQSTEQYYQARYVNPRLMITYDDTPVQAPVPEPSTLMLSGLGLANLGWFYRRSRRRG